MFGLKDTFFELLAHPSIDVNTGHVEVCADRGVLCARALGSCVAVVAYDPSKRSGGIAHVMLPGRAGDGSGPEALKYCEDAVDRLLERLRASGSGAGDLRVALVGGADLLGEGDIHVLVAESVRNYLRSRGVVIGSQCLGGNKPKSVSLDVGSGRVIYKEGDGTATVLKWRPQQKGDRAEGPND